MAIRLERSYLQIPYRAVRTPLDLFDQLVVVRVFGAGSSAHRIVAHGLQQLDTLAESAFGHSPGTPPAPTGSTATTKAAPTKAAPTKAATTKAATTKAATTKAATTKAAPTKAAPAEPIPAEEQQEIEQLAESFVAEQALAPRAGELAENDDIRRVQAEIRAKQAVEDDRGQI